MARNPKQNSTSAMTNVEKYACPGESASSRAASMAVREPKTCAPSTYVRTTVAAASATFNAFAASRCVPIVAKTALTASG